jgi:hypothetical protein
MVIPYGFYGKESTPLEDIWAMHPK